ncbi:hypothetical protein [Algicola sagamiensis]|uniref:hypothetical protein n=1 Tax=Algicola sagamiensis TaxID=163869 RepID=UPI00036B4EE4|nr:hypothetical protein [Algicola sagamiensis]
MRHIIWSVLCSTCCASFFTQAHTYHVRSSLTAEIYTESQPFEAFLDDWDKPYEPGDSAFTHNRFEFGVGWNEHEIGTISRYDYTLDFDSDTALFTHTEKNNRPFEDRDYRYRLRARNSTSHGMYYRYRYTIMDGLTLTPTLQLLGSKHYQDGNVDGTINNQNRTGQLNVDYFFSWDILFKALPIQQRPTGRGYAIDLLGEWWIDSSWKVSLHLKDLIHRVKFKSSPFAQGQTAKSTVRETETGGIETFPTITLFTHLNGNEKDHTLKLPMRYDAGVEYVHSKSLRGQFFTLGYEKDVFFRGLGYWKFWQEFELMFGYQTKSKTLHIGIEHPVIYLRYMTDDFDTGNSFHTGLSLGWKIAW